MKTIAMALVMVLPAAAQQGAPDPKRIDALVADLGSDDFAVREAADQELRKIGEAAVPALKKAVEGTDAERADRARKIIEHIGKAKRSMTPAPSPGALPGGVRLSSTFIYRDLSTGVSFKQDADGKVEVTVPVDDDKSGRKVYKTFTADSFEAFKTAHPDIVATYNLESMRPRVQILEERDPFGGKHPIGPKFPFTLEPPDPFDPDSLEKWLQEQMKELEELRRRMKGAEADPDPVPPSVPTLPQPRPQEKGAEFGIKIDPVGETLRAQLGLAEGAGVQVEFVKEGSIAGKAGVKLHDIIVSLRGKAVVDKWEFRRALKEALGLDSFEIEVIRGGKKQAITVNPAKKD